MRVPLRLSWVAIAIAVAVVTVLSGSWSTLGQSPNSAQGPHPGPLPTVTPRGPIPSTPLATFPLHPASPANPTSYPSRVNSHLHLGPYPGCKAVTQSSSIVISVNASSECGWTTSTLGPPTSGQITVSLPVTLTGGGRVNVEPGVQIELYNDLFVTDGVSLVLGGSDTLVINPTGNLQVLTVSGLFLNRSTLDMEGGELYVNHGTVMGNTNSTNSTQQVVQDLNVTGTGLTGTVNISDSAIEWMNITHGTYSVTLTGSYAQPVFVDHVITGNATLSTFLADNVDLGSISLGLVDNLTLGNPYTTASDNVTVANLFVNQVNYTITLAHATVGELHWSGARSANIVASTFSAASTANITDVSASFVATGGTLFPAPLVFSGTSTVKLVNISAPQLLLNGVTRASLYNWPGNTVVSGGGIPSLQSVLVRNDSAYAQVFRYLTVQLQGAGGTLPPSSTVVSFTMASVPNAVPILYALPPKSSVLALYLPTDNVSAGGDTYTGDYSIVATAPGMSATARLNVESDNLRTALELSPEVYTPSFPYPYLVAESGALVAVVVASVYLILQNRRRRSGTGGPTARDEEAARVPT